MKEKITSPQMMYAAAVLIFSASLLTKPLYTFTKNDSWIAVILGAMMAALIMMMYAILTRKFPGQTIIEINDKVFGRIAGKLISALYVYFFFFIACLDTNIIGEFIKAFILPSTPMFLILFLFLFILSLLSSTQT
jgi:spore germination protein KB